MISYRLLAIGKLKSNAPEYSIIERLSKRLKTSLSITEIDLKAIKNPKGLNDAENQEIINNLKSSHFNIALDKDGKEYSSQGFSKFLEDIHFNHGSTEITFIIGGADGLNAKTKELCQTRLSFGKQTWPHMLARVMLIEQLYRAQCIKDGHPYHK